MFKKLAWKPLLIGLGWTISLAGLVVLMSFIEVKKAEVVCKSIKVYIPGSHYFIDRQEVDNILQMDSHSLIGRRIENINIHSLENKLKNNPFVEFAKVYVDMDGVLQVEVSQRQPILRVMNRFEQDFYVDQNGLKIPLSQNFTARVVAANGFIDELFANKVDSLHTNLAKDIFKTADFIRKDSLWDAQIAQIYVNQDHEIELIPRVGNQRILLGNADSLALKFDNLRIFYQKALPMVGWDAYKIINIKYANQVVGVKSQTLVDSLAAVAARAKHTPVKIDSGSVPAISADAEEPATRPAKVNRDSLIMAAITNDTEKPKAAKAVVPVKRTIAKPATVNTPAAKQKTDKPAEDKTTAKPAAIKPPAMNTDKKKTEKKTSIKN